MSDVENQDYHPPSSLYIKEAYMYKKILVPLDGSVPSEDALPLVLTLAGVNKAEIVLLRVAEYPYSLYSMCDDYPPIDPDLVTAIQNKKGAIFCEVSEYLERTASTIARSGLKVNVEVCEGPVVESILTSADRLHVDLIILSTCGRSGGSHWVIGSIADRVLCEAQVPVILIRPEVRTFMPGLVFEQRANLYA
jgi:nucleotide-binding universal stress UspA family protein